MQLRKGCFACALVTGSGCIRKPVTPYCPVGSDDSDDLPSWSACWELYSQGQSHTQRLTLNDDSALLQQCFCFCFSITCLNDDNELPRFLHFGIQKEKAALNINLHQFTHSCWANFNWLACRCPFGRPAAFIVFHSGQKAMLFIIAIYIKYFLGYTIATFGLPSFFILCWSYKSNMVYP